MSCCVPNGLFSPTTRVTNTLKALYKRFVFRPPSPPTYEVDMVHNTIEVACACQFDAILQKQTVNQSLFSLRTDAGHRKEAHIPMHYVVGHSGRRIVTARFLHPTAKQIIIYSHGNGEDLGVNAKLGFLLATDLDVSVICYDYSGYGHSEGTPSESNCYEDITAVYEYVTNGLGYKPCDVILMGWSLGSGPTVELAARLGINYTNGTRHKLICKHTSRTIYGRDEETAVHSDLSSSPLGGVILCSAFTSILGIARKAQLLQCMDTFDNLRKMNCIEVPVLVIHGTGDDVIAVNHGRQLYEQARNPFKPVYVLGAKHEDIYTDPFRNEVRHAIAHALENWKGHSIKKQEEEMEEHGKYNIKNCPSAEFRYGD